MADIDIIDYSKDAIADLIDKEYYDANYYNISFEFDAESKATIERYITSTSDISTFKELQNGLPHKLDSSRTYKDNKGNVKKAKIDIAFNRLYKIIRGKKYIPPFFEKT